MSTGIDTKNSPQKVPIFDHSLIYNAKLPNIKEQVAKGALDEAWSKKSEGLTTSRVAHKIIDNAYELFKKTVKEQYSRPDFDFFLECSIQKQYSYFYNDLLKRIEQALEGPNPDSEIGPQ